MDFDMLCEGTGGAAAAALSFFLGALRQAWYRANMNVERYSPTHAVIQDVFIIAEECGTSSLQMIPDKDLEASCSCRTLRTRESLWAKQGDHRKSGEQFRAELGESAVAA